MLRLIIVSLVVLNLNSRFMTVVLVTTSVASDIHTHALQVESTFNFNSVKSTIFTVDAHDKDFLASQVEGTFGAGDISSSSVSIKNNTTFPFPSRKFIGQLEAVSFFFTFSHFSRQVEAEATVHVTPCACAELIGHPIGQVEMDAAFVRIGSSTEAKTRDQPILIRC